MAQQTPRQPQDAQQSGRHRTPAHGDSQASQTREPAEGSRETAREHIDRDQDTHTPDAHHDGGHHPSGISNRGIDSAAEQQDLPDRGTTRE